MADDEPEVLMTLVVLSDLHCVGDDRNSYLSDSLIRYPIVDGRRRSPLAGLHDLIEDSRLAADYLVCPGDLTNRAGVDGFRYGWAELEAVARHLNARAVIFTPGNHDLDTHDLNGAGDPRSCLAAVAPDPDLRPNAANGRRLEVDHFEIYQHGNLVLLNIDTNGKDPFRTQGKYGRIELDTVDEMGHDLSRMIKPDTFVVVICHHHPYRHGDIDLEDYSALDHAPELLEMFERLGGAGWLIVHGHKHYPRIRAHGSRLTIFSAGSLAGSFRGPLQCRARNQCYELKITLDRRLGIDHPPVGKYRAWDWNATQWMPALDGFGIPRQGGFGAVVQLETLAGQVADFVSDGPNRSRKIDEFLSIFPQTVYLAPNDSERLVERLYSVHNIDITTSRQTGEWRELGAMA